jgi:nucleoside-triphosphatase
MIPWHNAGKSRLWLSVQRGGGMNDDSRPFRNLLVTGLPGCGKTTLIRNLARDLSPFHPAGFYTEEVRIKGQRKGFRLIGLNGATSLLAHVDLHGGPRVGKYRVDVDQFEAFLDGQKLDQVATSLVFVDEIGKMECLSHRFVDLVRRLLDSPKILIATVALKGSGLITEVKERPDVALVEVAPGNRNSLVKELADLISAMAGE